MFTILLAAIEAFATNKNFEAEGGYIVAFIFDCVLMFWLLK